MAKQLNRKNRTAEDAARLRKQLAAIRLDENQADSLCRLNSHICGAVPQDAAQSGAYEPKDDPRFAGATPVPDGRYRITGSDWILTVRSRRLTLIERALPEVDPAGYVTVPSD